MQAPGTVHSLHSSRNCCEFIARFCSVIAAFIAPRDTQQMGTLRVECANAHLTRSSTSRVFDPSAMLQFAQPLQSCSRPRLGLPVVQHTQQFSPSVAIAVQPTLSARQSQSQCSLLSPKINTHRQPHQVVYFIRQPFAPAVVPRLAAGLSR